MNFATKLKMNTKKESLKTTSYNLRVEKEKRKLKKSNETSTAPK